LVEDAVGLVRACACRAGCPACIGPVLPGDEQRAETPKRAALTVLDLLIERAEQAAAPLRQAAG
jgi:DEAD/DEAH box helicase domain-containing protein